MADRHDAVRLQHDRRQSHQLPSVIGHVLAGPGSVDPPTARYRPRWLVGAAGIDSGDWVDRADLLGLPAGHRGSKPLRARPAGRKSLGYRPRLRREGSVGRTICRQALLAPGEFVSIVIESDF